MNNNSRGFQNQITKILWIVPTIIGAIIFYIELEKGILGYDEADYVTAVRKGMWANYWDVNSLPIHDFIKKGAESVILVEHSSFANEIRDRKDITFYRHFHAPVLFYILAISSTVFGDEDFIFRRTIWVIAVLLIPTVYWCVRTITHETWLALVAAFLVAISPMISIQYSWISVHAIFTLLAIFALTFQIKFFQSQKTKYYYLFVASLTFSFLTNEYALFLFIVCLLNFLLVPNKIISFTEKKLQLSYHAFTGGVLFLFIFILLWPAGILKLSVIKNYLFFAYFALIKKASAYGSQSIFDIWITRFISYPIESLLIVFGIGYGIYGFLSKKLNKSLLPLMIYPIIILFVNFLNKLDIYITTAYPFFLIFSAFGIHFFMKKVNKFKLQILSISILLIVLTTGNIVTKPHNYHEDSFYLERVIRFLKERSQDNENILVSYGYMPTLGYYLPNLNVDTIYREDKPTEILAKLASKSYQYFIFLDDPEELEKPIYSEPLNEYYKEILRIAGNGKKLLVMYYQNKE